MSKTPITPPEEVKGFAVYARGLTRRFGSFVAVDQIDLSVSPGNIFGFLGANGAGKTTVIRMLCGLLKPSGGEAWVANFSVTKNPEDIKRRIGYMSQRFSLYEDLTLEENLQFYGGVYGLSKEENLKRRQETMERLGVTANANDLPASLPLGYKQRLALGCAVIHEPAILFLDEPTGGVDPMARRIFWNLIYEMSGRGVTIFVTTHYMDEAEYCNHISIMDQGKIVALGSPTELKARYQASTIQDVFVKAVRQ